MWAEEGEHPRCQPSVRVPVLGARSGLLVCWAFGHSPLWQIAQQRKHRKEHVTVLNVRTDHLWAVALHKQNTVCHLMLVLFIRRQAHYRLSLLQFQCAELQLLQERLQLLGHFRSLEAAHQGVQSREVVLGCSRVFDCPSTAVNNLLKELACCKSWLQERTRRVCSGHLADKGLQSRNVGHHLVGCARTAQAARMDHGASLDLVAYMQHGSPHHSANEGEYTGHRCRRFSQPSILCTAQVLELVACRVIGVASRPYSQGFTELDIWNGHQILQGAAGVCHMYDCESRLASTSNVGMQGKGRTHIWLFCTTVSSTGARYGRACVRCMPISLPSTVRINWS